MTLDEMRKIFTFSSLMNKLPYKELIWEVILEVSTANAINGKYEKFTKARERPVSAIWHQPGPRVQLGRKRLTWMRRIKTAAERTFLKVLLFCGHYYNGNIKTSPAWRQ